MNTDTKQILNTVKSVFLENKLLFPGWVLMVMSCGMLMVGIAFFITILSILYFQQDLLVALLIGFLSTGVIGSAIGSVLLTKIFSDKE